MFPVSQPGSAVSAVRGGDVRRALLIGSNGQVGTEIVRAWKDAPGLCEIDLTGLTHADLEITDKTAVQETLAAVQPDIVINTAGFLRVDECERVPEQAFAVNAIAVKHLAEAASIYGSYFIQFSTDYVFDGYKSTPYQETDQTTPLNSYGLSKLAGEYFVRYCLPDSHLIVRTSGVFGPAGSTNKGGNFIETMLRLAATGRELTVVNDQAFSPTYAPDLAQATLALIAADAHGTVHISNSGATNWHEFASTAFSLAGLEPQVRAVTSSEYASAAIRPRYSVLDNQRSIGFGIRPLRPWEAALSAYMEARAGS